MIKGITTLIFCLMGMPAALFAQQLSNQVLVPLAGLASENSINYSQTVGETAIEIVRCSEYVFTEGFQQPRIKVTPGEVPKGTGVNVYPNPVSDFITIELFSETAKTFMIDFISITGNVVLSEKKVFNDKFWFKDPLSIENLIRGFYLVRVYSDDGVINRTFKIEKL
jgi:hypothetical protein